MLRGRQVVGAAETWTLWLMRTRAKQFEGWGVVSGKQAILGCGSAAWLVTDQSDGSGPTTVRPVMT